MKSYKAYSDSAYLKKEDFPKSEVLRIEEVREEEVTAPGKKPKMKVILYFSGIDKGLVLNQANGDVLAAITGTDDPEQWVGVTVVAYNDPNVVFGNKPVGGIRLRKPRAATKPHKPVQMSEPTSAEPEEELNAELAANTSGEPDW